MAKTSVKLEKDWHKTATDIVVNTVLRNYTIDKPLCPLEHHKCTRQFCKSVYREPSLPTILVVRQPQLCNDQNSWRQNIVTDLEMIIQPVFWAHMQETQV